MFLAFLASFGGGFASAQTLIRDESDLQSMHRLSEHVGGNVQRNDGYFEYQWPAVYFEARFYGSQVFFKIDDNYNRFRVLIDGHEIGNISRPLASQYEVSGLTVTEHVIRLEKLSESLGQSGKFHGFYVQNTTLARAAAHRQRRIEFIGDSYLAGYGNLSQSRQCPRTLFDNTDNTKAYGPIVARHFDADFQINAYSGIGMVRNYANNLPSMPMSHFYGRPVYIEDTRSNPGDFQPQIILVALGTNDFSTPIGDNEKWRNNDELIADYVQSHLQFLQGLRAANPRAMILIAANINARPNHVTALAQVEAEFGQADNNFHRVYLPKLENTGCDWHPNLNDHLSMAQIVISKINELNPNW